MDPTVVLVPGTDYPRDWLEFQQFFPDEQSCWDYLRRVRWGATYRCPVCGSLESKIRASGLVQCCRCYHRASVLAGTIFEGTRKPLRLWFGACWYVTNQKGGVSALGLQRVLGLEQYRTAWTWLHKLRRAMVRPGRDRLSGTVEVDETYVGGEEAGARGRQTISKAIVVIAAEEDGNRIGRIRLAHIPDVSTPSLMGFIRSSIETGSTIHTDGWSGYNALQLPEYNHVVTVMSQSSDPAHVLMPLVHRVASLLKRWWLGTHQGGFGMGHLEYYLDEFTFRFNRRRSAHRGLLFYRLLQQAVQVGPVPYQQMAQENDTHWSKRV